MKTPQYKSITLITSPGKGLPIVEELFRRNFHMVDLHHARGSQIGAATKRNGMPIEGEQEIVTCVVDANQADDAFRQIYEVAKVDQPGGGFLYMQNLSRSTELVLPKTVSN